jgi:hypothetical protein
MDAPAACTASDYLWRPTTGRRDSECAMRVILCKLYIQQVRSSCCPVAHCGASVVHCPLALVLPGKPHRVDGCASQAAQVSVLRQKFSQGVANVQLVRWPLRHPASLSFDSAPQHGDWVCTMQYMLHPVCTHLVHCLCLGLGECWDFDSLEDCFQHNAVHVWDRAAAAA